MPAFPKTTHRRFYRLVQASVAALTAAALILPAPDAAVAGLLGSSRDQVAKPQHEKSVPITKTSVKPQPVDAGATLDVKKRRPR
ncbi:hypothetical protein [Fodinicola feengrottensis]|uniref:hypothetical protein n=1 Tax=Fodinicola feengrottensis TaxID=435914 RepID=UPI002441A4EA|nr:hypothetical protein [Fodinicola feengrottensis]